MKHDDLIPLEVSECIVEDILPELANGDRSARKIVQLVVEQAYHWLTDEADKKEPIGDQRNFTYCWVIACKLHRDLMMKYIERAFVTWD